MVNKGLKQEDIFQAAIELKQKGEEPSAKKIREHLGTGSLTTISKYFKQWLEGQTVNNEELDLQKIFEDIDPTIIGEFFSGEHPQIVALVFSHLKPKQVADILNHLPQEMQDDVLKRMEKLELVQQQFVQKLAKFIMEELSTIINSQGVQKGGSDFVNQVKRELNK